MRVRLRRKRKKWVLRGKNELARQIETASEMVAGIALPPLRRTSSVRGLENRTETEFSDQLGNRNSEETGLHCGEGIGRELELFRSDDSSCRWSEATLLEALTSRQTSEFGYSYRKESVDPINKVVYISESDTADGTQSRQHTEATRFNLFTGNQSLEQREQCFKVNETSRVHCGFYSENGGFKVSDEDKSFMKTCIVVVSTCTFGGGDDLYHPIGMSETSLQKVCYVAFWDEITLAAQEAAGHRIAKDHYIGKWRVVLVRNFSFSDQMLNGKIPKDIDETKEA